MVSTIEVDLGAVVGNFINNPMEVILKTINSQMITTDLNRDREALAAVPAIEVVHEETIEAAEVDMIETICHSSISNKIQLPIVQHRQIRPNR